MAFRRSSCILLYFFEKASVQGYNDQQEAFWG